MRLSFNDQESFKEAIESLRFDNPSDQQTGSSGTMMALQELESERNEPEDIIIQEERG
jgi:hypothetical protein